MKAIMKWLLGSITIICSIISRGVTYSTGAPAEGCWSERPLHRDYLPQGGHVLPFTISTNASSYGPSETIVVSIESPIGVQHKGFLLRTVTSSGLRGGRWAVDRSLQRYNPECGVTHNDPRDREVTTVLWRSPSALMGHLGKIQFKAIVVANLSHFWDNILSVTLTPVYPEANKATLRSFHKMFSLLGQDTNNTTASSSSSVSSTSSTSEHAQSTTKGQEATSQDSPSTGSQPSAARTENSKSSGTQSA